MDNRYPNYNLKNMSSFADLNVCEELAGFEKMRVSALKNAAEISHLVTEVTIGPNKTDRPVSIVTPSSNDDEAVDLLGDNISDDVRNTLLNNVYESEMQNNSADLFNNLLENMLSAYTEKNHTLSKKHTDNLDNKSFEMKEKKLQMAKQFQENDNLKVLEKSKLDKNKYEVLNSQTIDNMNRILDEQNKAEARFSLITNSRTKTFICYNEILNLVQTGQISKKDLEKYEPNINSIILGINTITNSCEPGIITDKDVIEAESLSINIEIIKEKIKEEILTRKKQHDKKRQEEEDIRIKELEARRIKENKAALAARNKEKEIKTMQKMFYSENNYSQYIKLNTFVNEYESRYKKLLETDNLKKFRFDCQKAVNTPVNALSSVSGAHMRDKYNKLEKLLRGQKVRVLNTFVTAAQHYQGIYYCTALLAKKIIRQGDLLVSSNPEAAFPLAAITVALWSQFPEFGKLLQGYFYRYCPYLVPMLLPRTKGQTDKDFYISRGYIYNDDGVEKQDKFLKRMSGIFKLYCAILIAKTPNFINVSNPHGLSFGWQWIASFINLKPEPDICATLILDFFTVCGSEFFKAYGKQCVKLIKLISTEYMAILQKIDEGGPKTRLEVFLQNVLNSGYIEPPNGQLEPSMW